MYMIFLNNQFVKRTDYKANVLKAFKEGCTVMYKYPTPNWLTLKDFLEFHQD